MNVDVSLLIGLAVLLLQLVTIFGFVLLERRQPAATMAWVLALFLLPLLGVLLYLTFGVKRLARRRREGRHLKARIDAVLMKHEYVRKARGVEDPALGDARTQILTQLARNLEGPPPSAGNRCDLLINAAATYRSMIHAIEGARDHVHVLFYIIQPDETGRALRDRLAATARRGVQVRVLCDAVGSIALPGDFWDPLVEAGGQAAYYAPVNLLYRLRRRDRIDYRNHRKIVIADGRVGYTGGINVGREYLGLNPEVGHWRDTHVRIEGPAALALQGTFAEDWLATTGELLDEPRYYPEPPLDAEEGSVVQVVDSGPDRTWSPLHQLFFQAFTLARKRIWVTSPYFIPDAVIEQALVTAALRGVDVRLLVPSRSDSRLVDFASRAYYPNLLQAGVRIFEYARGFVHAKSLLVDDWVATVGSANMDTRSFHLSYELNVMVFDSAFTRELSRVFLDDLRDAREIDLESQRRLGYFRRIAQAVAQLWSPLL